MSNPIDQLAGFTNVEGAEMLARARALVVRSELRARALEDLTDALDQLRARCRGRLDAQEIDAYLARACARARAALRSHPS